MRKLIGATLVATLVLGACTDEEPGVGFEGLPSESESPTAESSPAASAEATTAEIDVTTTPDEITPEWVTAVVNTLLAEYGDLEQEIASEPVKDESTLTPEDEKRLRAIFAGERLDVSSTETRSLLVDLDGLRSTLLPPKDYEGLRFEAELVQYAENDCVIAVGRIDRSGTIPDGGQADSLSALSLVPNDDRDASARWNPTEWKIVDILPNTGPDGEFLPDETMLNASLADYGTSLENTCGGES